MKIQRQHCLLDSDMQLLTLLAIHSWIATTPAQVAGPTVRRLAPEYEMELDMAPNQQPFNPSFLMIIKIGVGLGATSKAQPSRLVQRWCLGNLKRTRNSLAG